MPFKRSRLLARSKDGEVYVERATADELHHYRKLTDSRLLCREGVAPHPHLEIPLTLVVIFDRHAQNGPGLGYVSQPPFWCFIWRSPRRCHLLIRELLLPVLPLGFEHSMLICCSLAARPVQPNPYPCTLMSRPGLALDEGRWCDVALNRPPFAHCLRQCRSTSSSRRWWFRRRLG